MILLYAERRKYILLILTDKNMCIKFDIVDYWKISNATLYSTWNLIKIFKVNISCIYIYIISCS